MINILITFFVLYACSSSSPQAPVSSRNQPPSTKVASHVVAPGETLYSIAWRYGLDYKKLARNNGIDGSYSIFPGQVINLANTSNPYSQQQTSPTTSVSPHSNRVTSGANSRQPVRKIISPPVSSTKAPVASSKKARSEKKSSQVVKSSSYKATSGKIYWKWPSGGKVLTNFYSKSTFKKGIDIQGKKGDSVIAAAAGEVVYAGSGLRGYGKLVIIKHSDIYLSAYAHNNRLLVKEGEIVKAGQRIADIGSTGIGTNGKPKLHFQIRRNGKPIDPVPLLPKRK